MKGINHIRCDFHLVALGHSPGVGLGGTGGQKIYFSDHGNVAYQIKEDNQSTRIH